MNWKKHILVAAISLNCVLYLGTGIGLTINNTQQVQEDLSRYATHPHQTLETELSQVTQNVKNLLIKYHMGLISMTKKLEHPESSLLKLVDISKIISGKLEHLPSFSHSISIPLILLESTEPYSLMYFDNAKKLYMSQMIGPVNLNDKDEQQTPYSYIITYEVQKEKWLETISAKNSVHLSIIEQDYNMKPFVLFTNLNRDESDQLLQQTPLTSNSAYKRVSKNYIDLLPHTSAFKATLAGTKTITYPFVLNTSPEIQQVIYYTLPLPDFYAISRESVFALVVAFLAISTAALIAGMSVIKTSEATRAKKMGLTAFSFSLSLFFFTTIYFKTGADTSQKTAPVVLLFLLLSSLIITALAHYYDGRQKDYQET